jgi:hypothetical protein
MGTPASRPRYRATSRSFDIIDVVNAASKSREESEAAL